MLHSASSFIYFLRLHPRHDPVEGAGIGVLTQELVLGTAEVVADLLE